MFVSAFNFYINLASFLYLFHPFENLLTSHHKPCFVCIHSQIISVNPRNHDADSRNYTVNRRNHTDNLEMDAFLCIFTSN